MKTFLVFLGLAAGGFAQNTPPRPVIQGTVVEYGTNRGLAGATVLLKGDGIDVRNPPHQTSDSQGKFRFELEKFGHYNVTVQMEGYRALADLFLATPNDMAGALGAIPMPLAQSVRVSLTSGYSTENLRFTLVQAGEMTGRVVDEETGEPIVHMEVRSVSPRYVNGQIVVADAGARALTNDDGQFLFSSLNPGSYLVETVPLKNSGRGAVTEFSEDDLKAGDQDYERSYWPGGTDRPSTSSLPLASGGFVDVGTLKVRKANYYRVHGILTPSNCRPGDKVQVIFATAVSGQGIEAQTGSVACGQDFLFKNVQPGSYRLTLFSGDRPDVRVQASELVEVTDRNAEVRVALQHGQALNGHLIAADGAGQIPLDRLLVDVRPVDVTLSSGPPVRGDAQGRFTIANAMLGRQEISFINMGNFYVKEVRYNGVPLSGRRFVIDGSPGLVEVVLDDKPASITGAVEDFGNPASKPFVMLTNWPISSDGMASASKNVNGDEQGKFRFTGLTPGEYRILAVPAEARQILQEPGVMDRLFSTADSVTVGPSESKDLRLKLVDPTR